MKFAVLTALVAITLPVPAFAADWVLVGDSVSGSKLYVDLQSIRTMPNGYKRAWSRTDLKIPDKDGDNIYTGYREFDCVEKRARPLSIIFRKGEQVTYTNNAVGEWSYFSPDSMFEGLQNFVCYGKR